MDKLEEVGRKLDEELTRLRRFVEEDLAPETELKSEGGVSGVVCKAAMPAPVVAPAWSAVRSRV